MEKDAAQELKNTPTAATVDPTASAAPGATAPWATMGEFSRLQLHVGTVLSCRPNARARVPAYVMEMDFGPLGRKTTSAQTTENHAPEELLGAQVVAVTNLPPRRVAGVKSEVLVLASVSAEAGTVLLRPQKPVPNGTRIS